MNEIGSNFQYFVSSSSQALETAWNANMNTFILMHAKITFWNAGDKITLTAADNNFILLIRDMKAFGFVQVVQSLLE